MGLFDKIRQLFGSSLTVVGSGHEIHDVQTNNRRVARMEPVVNKGKVRLEQGMKRLEEATCPYCEYQFDKPIARKKVCQSCTQIIYVRTLPFEDEKDKIRVTVTEEQAENIDIAWAKQNGTYHEMMQSKNRFEIMKEDLKRTWGKEPSESDIEWHLLIEERLKHANNNQWGLYRNATLHMAEHLYKLKNYDVSLRTYLEVLYLDLNGPTNAPNINGQYRLDERNKTFDPTKGNAFVAPGIIKRIVILKDKRIPMKDDAVKSLFMEVGEQVHHSLPLPLSPQKAWVNFEKDNSFWGNN